MQTQQPSSLIKREMFAIELRKSKKAKILSVKRAALYNATQFKLTESPVPSVSSLISEINKKIAAGYIED